MFTQNKKIYNKKCVKFIKIWNMEIVHQIYSFKIKIKIYTHQFMEIVHHSPYKYTLILHIKEP